MTVIVGATTPSVCNGTSLIENGACKAPVPSPPLTIGHCCHRSKKKLVNSKAVTKGIKDKAQCGPCSRNENSTSSANSPDGSLSMCLSCGSRFCRDHAHAHSNTARTEDHPFFYDFGDDTTRCNLCKVLLDMVDCPSTDVIKQAVGNIRSSKKTSTPQENGTSAAAPAPVVIDKPQPKPEKKEMTETKSKSSKKETMNHSNQNGHAYTQSSVPENTALPAQGLSNLGNTCFFNSVMQCILHTHQISFYLKRFGRVKKLTFDSQSNPMVINDEKVDIEEATLTVPSGAAPLNDALRAFIVDFRNGRTPSPNNLFNQIAHKAARFRSMAQQDAHELLRYLLDGLCSEETGRYQEAIAGLVGAPVRSTARVDAAIVRKAKAYLQLAGRPLLDAVFGGRLLQTIRCSRCHHVSERYEHFLDLSVPLTGGGGGSSRGFGGGGVTGGGVKTKTLSKHQQKKEHAAAKRASKKGRKQQRKSENEGELETKMNGLSIDKEETNGHQNGQPTSEDSGEGGDHVGEDEGVEEEEEEEEYESNGTGKTIDPLDLTKVLTPMAEPPPPGQSIKASLLEFTAEERLEGPNAYECEKCCTPHNKERGLTGSSKRRVEAAKRYLIVTPPVVLTIHVKRFQQTHYGMKVVTRKVPGNVAFPLIFDIAPFCCKNVERISSNQTRVLYSLYGVVSHSGDLGGGHYVAYVKSRERLKQVDDMLETARRTCADVNEEAPRQTTSTMSPETAEQSVPPGQWYYCSDSRVSGVSESKVLGVEAYLLFYERIC